MYAHCGLVEVEEVRVQKAAVQQRREEGVSLDWGLQFVTGKGVVEVVYPEPHYEPQKGEPEKLWCAVTVHVLVVVVFGSVGKRVEEEVLVHGREHWDGFSCSASFASVVTQELAHHWKH